MAHIPNLIPPHNPDGYYPSRRLYLPDAYTNPEAEPVPFPLAQSGPGTHDTDADFKGLLFYGRVLWRGKFLILSAALFCAAAAWVYCKVQVPMSRASVFLEFQSPSEADLNLPNVNRQVPYSEDASDSYILTQVELIQAEAPLRRVVNKLKLNANRKFLFPPTTMSTIKSKIGIATREPDEVTVGLNGDRLALGQLRSNLSVVPVRHTKLVRLMYDSPDPALAANIANALASEFIQQNLQSRLRTMEQLSEWLSQQLVPLKSHLEGAEGDLQNYARGSGLLFTDDKNNVAEERLRQLQQEYLKAQADRVALQAQYERVAQSKPDWLPSAEKDGSVREYQGKLTELRRQRAELSVLLTPSNYKIEQLDAQIAEFEAALKRELVSTQKRIENEYQAAQKREAALGSAYAAQARVVSEQALKAIRYGTLKREVETARDFHAAMLHKLQEAKIASALRASNIDVVDPASPPSEPFKPNVRLNLVIGTFAGLCLGVLAVVWRDQVDHRIKAPGAVLGALSIPELGAIPTAPGGLMRAARKSLSISPATEQAVGGSTLVMRNGATSLLTESFLETVTSLRFSGMNNGARLRSAIVTSPGPAEGKTTVAANLGAALAGPTCRVLLIDGDMRRPALHRMFDMSNETGLSDLLHSDGPVSAAELNELVKPTAIPHLSLLASGPTVADAASLLLHSKQFPEIMAHYKTMYDIVLLDSTPALFLADARMLARAVDGVILVIRAGRTTHEEAAAAAQRLMADRLNILGTVLNDWNPDKDGSYKRTNYQAYWSGKS